MVCPLLLIGVYVALLVGSWVQTQRLLKQGDQLLKDSQEMLARLRRRGDGA